MIAALAPALDAAIAARARLRGRPVRETAAALADAAARWRGDAELRAALPAAIDLTPPVVAAGLDAAAGALDADDMMELAARELGATPPAAPALIAHVLASNVPALALPAAALACLAGSAVLLKSGRADPLSAPAFQRALAAVDPELAATIVAAYWRGGDVEAERALASATVVVASGSDASIAALARRLGDRLIGHGARTSVAVVATDDATVPRALARDVAMHDQRGCLSPQAVFVAGDVARFAERLLSALEAVADELPWATDAVATRAARRTALATAEWDGARVLAGAGGTVVVAPDAGPRPAIGGRTVWVHGIASAADVPALLPPNTIECVGIAGAVVDLDALRARGVARVCPVGRMQRPRLSWPRGQRPPLRALLDAACEPTMEVEPA